LVSDLGAGADGQLMKFAGILDLEEPWGAQKMNSKLSWQVGERVHDEEVTVWQREVLRVVLTKENPNGYGLGHLEEVLKRVSLCLHRKTDLNLEMLYVRYNRGST